MPIFKPGDIVRVPFPFVETPFQEVRPALVISAPPLGPTKNLFWALMITSAANKGWPGDISIEADHLAFGLPAPSVIRTEKIAVLEAQKATLLGAVSEEVLAQVKARVAGNLGLGVL
jgi:mRNA interferase MazF